MQGSPPTDEPALVTTVADEETTAKTTPQYPESTPPLAEPTVEDNGIYCDITAASMPYVAPDDAFIASGTLING